MVLVVFYSSNIYSIFLPLRLSTLCFYMGFCIYTVGIVTETIALHNFATTPVDKLVTKDLYRISRNPMYIGEVLKSIGIGLTCISWIYLLIAIVELILWHKVVLFEEGACLELYGDAYQDYLNKTPRWIGIPKLRKND